MLKATAGIIVAAGVSFLFMDYALSIPEVYKSYSSRECVKVENYPGLVFGKDNYTCESMPAKFEVVWVK
jgi:hypothetical protein